MFTLTLHYLPGEQYKTSAQQTVASSHIPQIGSTVSGGDVRYGTYQVVLVGHTVENSVMSDAVYVYLKETDIEDTL